MIFFIYTQTVRLLRTPRTLNERSQVWLIVNFGLDTNHIRLWKKMENKNTIHIKKKRRHSRFVCLFEFSVSACWVYFSCVTVCMEISNEMSRLRSLNIVFIQWGSYRFPHIHASYMLCKHLFSLQIKWEFINFHCRWGSSMHSHGEYASKKEPKPNLQ